MSEEMGTTNTVPTASASRLAHTEQVKPTPGPWHASRKRSFVMTSNHAVIAEIRGCEERDANALLIAAAPEMLDALKALANLDERCGWHSTALDQANAAIDRAEGRTP